MVKKILGLITVLLALNVSSLAIADTCLPQFQGINFYEAMINLSSNGMVFCSYTPSVFYIAKYNSKPVSGPWKNTSINIFECVAPGQAGACVFS